MSSNLSRRTFLIDSLKVGLGMALLTKTEHIFSQTNKEKTKVNNRFEQQPLPYKYDALEPYIDALTMEIHYSKHAATYCKNLNEAAIAEKLEPGQSLDSILSNVSAHSTKIRNNGGGHYNHEIFWQSMRAPQTNNQPDGALLHVIEKTFGSFDEFKKQFTDAAKNRFGSGWAWLVKDNNNELRIGSTANQDNPLMALPEITIKGTPLLGLDVWEHAYYLKYQNKRADYIEGWWKIVNWEKVTERWEKK